MRSLNQLLLSVSLLSVHCSLAMEGGGDPKENPDNASEQARVEAPGAGEIKQEDIENSSSSPASAFPQLPEELKQHIVGYLPLDSIKQFGTVSRGAHKDVQRRGHIKVKAETSIEQLYQLIESNKDHLVSLDLERLSDHVTDDVLKHIMTAAPRIRTINLSDCQNITDEGLKYLTNATTINLSFCKQITDKGLARLTNATWIDLHDCNQITDAGLEHLTNATTINLSYCDQITDAGLKYLANATTIDLYNCKKITDAGLKYLTNATTINLIGCDQITDAGLEHLTNATTINLSDCNKITDKGLEHLTKATTINLSDCIITDAGLAHLTNATTIDLSDCIITDAGLAHLTNATWIDLRGCYEITNKAKETLRQRGVEIIG